MKNILKIIINFIIYVIAINSIVFAGFADFSDTDARKETEELLESQEKEEKELANKSTNNYLSVLKVEGYTLTPEFDKQTQEYIIEDNIMQESIKIEAITDDERATVEGAGDVKLNFGENKIRIDVNAESGTVRTYFINVNRKKETKEESVKEEIVNDESAQTNTSMENEVVNTEVNEEIKTQNQANNEKNAENKNIGIISFIVILVISLIILFMKK